MKSFHTYDRTHTQLTLYVTHAHAQTNVLQNGLLFSWGHNAKCLSVKQYCTPLKSSFQIQERHPRLSMFSSWTNGVSGGRNLHLADKRMSYEYAKSICCTKTWSSGPPVKSTNRRNVNAAEELCLSSSSSCFAFFLFSRCALSEIVDKHSSYEVFWGICCLRCSNTDCRLALPQTDKTDFPKVSISRTRLAAGYEWTKSLVVPNWQSITVNDGGKKNSSALVCSQFFFFMGQEKTRKHVYSWKSPERLAYNLLTAGFHMKMHSLDQRFWSGVTRARH